MRGSYQGNQLRRNLNFHEEFNGEVFERFKVFSNLSGKGRKNLLNVGREPLFKTPEQDFPIRAAVVREIIFNHERDYTDLFRNVNGTVYDKLCGILPGFRSGQYADEIQARHHPGS
jgi:hypothetical protein